MEIPTLVAAKKPLDGTPLLDIKPYTARFDRFDTTRNGWQDEINEETARLRGSGAFPAVIFPVSS